MSDGAEKWLTAKRKVPDALSASCVQNSVSMSHVSVRCCQWFLNSTPVEGLGLKKVLMSVFRSPQGAMQANLAFWFEEM